MSYGDLWPLVRISLTSFVVGFMGASLGTWAVRRWSHGADTDTNARIEKTVREIGVMLDDLAEMEREVHFAKLSAEIDRRALH